MCYKACFYNGGQPEEKDRHIIIFARAIRTEKEGTHTKTADGKQEKTEKRKAKLAKLAKTCSISTHTKNKTTI